MSSCACLEEIDSNTMQIKYLNEEIDEYKREINEIELRIKQKYEEIKLLEQESIDIKLNHIKQTKEDNMREKTTLSLMEIAKSINELAVCCSSVNVPLWDIFQAVSMVIDSLRTLLPKDREQGE